MNGLRVRSVCLSISAFIVLVSAMYAEPASAADVLFSKALLQGKTVDSYLIQLAAGDTLVFDAPPSGTYVVHGRRLIVIAASARVDANVTVSAFDGTDTPGPFVTVGLKGADGANGVGQTGGAGNPAKPGDSPVPIAAAQGASGPAAREMIFDIGNLTGSGKLTLDNSGGKGQKGQKGGKGGTGGQGAKGADGSDSLVDCLSSGGDAGAAGIGGKGGTGGTGGPGGSGGLILLSASLWGPPVNARIVTVTTGGKPGDPGDPGEHGDGGAAQDGGNGSTYCGGGHGTGKGGIGLEGDTGAVGPTGASGKVSPIDP